MSVDGEDLYQIPFMELLPIGKVHSTVGTTCREKTAPDCKKSKFMILNLIIITCNIKTHMSKAIPLTQVVDPFVRYPPWSSWKEDHTDAVWVMRPFWIIEDLRLVHQWLNDVNGKTNHDIKHSNPHPIQHYLKRLKSDREQSLSFLRNQVLVGQFDLVPIGNDRIPLQHSLKGEGFAIHFIFPPERVQHTYWETILQFLSNLVFDQYPSCSLYLEIPRGYYRMHEQVKAIGFVQVNEYVQQGGVVQLFQSNSPF
jgi:hypothetical protein